MGSFVEDVNTRRRIFLSLSKFGCGLQDYNSRKFHLHLTFRESWNNRDEVWKMKINFNSDVFAAVVVVDVAKRDFKKPQRQRQRKRRLKI